MTIKRFRQLICSSILSFFVLLTGCGKGDIEFIPLPADEAVDEPVDIRLTGGAVKGPIAFSDINIYEVDLEVSRYARFNDLANALFKVFADIGIRVEKGSLVLPDGMNDAQVLEAFKQGVAQSSYVSDLEYFKLQVSKATSLAQAKALLAAYLGEVSDADLNLYDLGLLVEESNSYVKTRVKEALNAYTNLSNFKTITESIPSFFEELVDQDSYSQIESLITTYSQAETNPLKQAGWTTLLSKYAQIKADSSSSASIVALFDETAFGDALNNDSLINIALSDNDNVAVNNLNQLKDVLSTDNNPETLKSAIYEAYRREGNSRVKAGLLGIYYSIVTYEDIFSIVRNDVALHSYLDIRETIESAVSFSELYARVITVLQQEAEPAFQSVLISEETEFNIPKNRLSYGQTGADSLLKGLQVGNYRGYLYIEALANDASIDLNSGKPPIVSKLVSLIHTDDIQGYSDNQRIDESIYFVKNGIIQRDSDDEIITDINDVEFEATDELLTVAPARFATPLTTLAFDISKYNITGLSGRIAKLNSEYANLNEAQKQRYFSVDDRTLQSMLFNSQKIVSESFNVTQGDSLPNISDLSPVIREHMKYFPKQLANTFRYRSNIEYYGALLKALHEQSNIAYEELQRLLARDLSDGQLDKKERVSTIAELAGIDNYAYLTTRDPSEVRVAGTDIFVSDIGRLFEKEFESVVGGNAFDLYKDPISSLEFVAARGGIDSDGDGILDNDDSILGDDNQGESNGYSGLRSVSVKFSAPVLIPLDKSLKLSIPIQQVIADGENKKLACVAEDTRCILVGDLNTDLEVSAQFVKLPSDTLSSAKASLIMDNGTRALELEIDTSTIGDHTISVQLESEVDSEYGNATTNFIFDVPVKVIDLRKLEFRVVSANNETTNPESVGPNNKAQVEFKVTSENCGAFGLCGIDGVSEGVFVNVEVLGSSFITDVKINNSKSETSYQDVSTFSEDQDKSVSNVKANEELDYSIIYNSKGLSITLTDLTADVIDPQSDLETECVDGVSGIDDVDGDGTVIRPGEPKCFSEIIESADSPTLVHIEDLKESWYINEEWHFIIRINSDNEEFIGYVPLPKNNYGEYPQIVRLLHDNDLRRVYLADSEGNVHYYSFTSDSVSNFYVSQGVDPIYAWQLLGSNVLLSWSPTQSVFVDQTGSEVQVSYNKKFPTPGSKLTPTLDGDNLGSFGINLIASYQIERYRDAALTSFSGVLSDDGLSLDSGQTQFGDKLTLSMVISSQEGLEIEHSQQSFILDTNGFAVSSNSLDTNNPPLIKASGLDLSTTQVNQNLYVKWYINNSSNEKLEYSFTNSSFPYIYESSKLEFGDIVSARVYLKRSESFSEVDDILVANVTAPYIGELAEISPIFDDQYWDDNLDLSKPSLKVKLIAGTDNDDFFNLSMIEPVWYINGDVVSGENSFSFPTNADTNIRFRDEISVGYIFKINGTFVQSAITNLPSISTKASETEFTIFPEIAEEGQSISLDISSFNTDALGNIQGRWLINGVYDIEETGLTYPGEKLKFGDRVKLKLAQVFDDRQPVIFDYDGAVSYVGLNLDKLTGSDSGIASIVDSDADGIPNYRDYFRYDKNCSVISEGIPDDYDQDGIADLDELSPSVATNPALADTDNDGLPDKQELEFGSSPLLADTDGDGYSDRFEYYWQSDPTDIGSPNILADIDKDGLSDEQELLNSTLVSNPDTDKDGLEDGLEVKLGTKPLIPDSDGDYLADGAELSITNTDPLLADTDEDGLEDGFEVALSRTSPNHKDTDSDGVFDSDESEAIDNTANVIYETLFVDDLESYNSETYLGGILPGTCFATYLASNSEIRMTYANNLQVDNDSLQEIMFFGNSLNKVVRYDANNLRFLKPIEVGDFDARLNAAAFDKNDISIVYLGFSDGVIRKVDTSDGDIEVAARFNLPLGAQVTGLTDQGDVLLVSAEDNGVQSLYVIDYLTPNNPVLLNQFVSLAGSVWQDGANQTLWAYASDDKLIRVDYVPASKSFSFTEFDSDLPIIAPIYHARTGLGQGVIATANGVEFDIDSGVFSHNQMSHYRLGLFHQNHHVFAPSAFRGIELKYGGDIDWAYRASLSGREVINIVPRGHEILLVSKPAQFTPDSMGAYQFKLIEVGDSDANGIPEWWQSIYAGGTLAQFNGQVHPGAPDFSVNNGVESLRNDDSDEGDMDDDGISNQIEQTLGSCVSFGPGCEVPNDSDLDGLTDLFEYNYRDTDQFNRVHTLDLTLSDTDGDGLSDADEVLVYGTYPDLQDSDGDLICDLHELEILGTDPLSNDSDGDGLSDGFELGIQTLSCSALARTTRFSDPLIADSDSDGLNDREEFQINSDPFKSDTDDDGLLDGQEAVFGGDPLNNSSRQPGVPDGEIDTDNDGLSDAYELNISHTDPSEGDSDSDGLSDLLELTVTGSNPNNSDTDGDYICDAFENIYGVGEGNLNTSPLLADSDLDGLVDSLELGVSGLEVVPCDALPPLNAVSDPTLVDTDSDGINDGEELDYLFGSYDDTFLEAHPDVKTTIDPMIADTDGDLICDSAEIGVSNPGEIDTDFDGLTDAQELQLELSEVYCSEVALTSGMTKPNNRDTDGDSLSDGQEVLITGTNPLDPDSNDDGISDGDEDSDGDGLSDHIELNVTMTSALNEDTDGDGIRDDVDDQDGDGLTNIKELELGTCVTFEAINCPVPQDSDQDGLSDFEEVQLAEENGTAPLSVDSDEDGISDKDEIDLGTSPSNKDSDYDGLEDLLELRLKTDPMNPDSDNDFLADGLDEAPLNADADGDGLPDGIEYYVLNTSPLNADSDGDLLLDGEEVWIYGYKEEGYTLLSYGPSPGLPLNSREGSGEAAPGSGEFKPVGSDDSEDSSPVSSYSIPNSYDGSESAREQEYRLFAINRVSVVNIDGAIRLSSVIADDIEGAIGSLHVRYVSNPNFGDSDSDGLSDYIELMVLEKNLGESQFDVNPAVCCYQEKKSNKTNFSLSDPFNADTDGDGISDGNEDADGDFFVNSLEVLEGKSSLVNPDTDGDTIPDGIESLVIKSNPGRADTDSDGLFDGDINQTGQIDYEVIYDTSTPPQLVSNSVSCGSYQYRITNVEGKDYCVELSYLSDPTTSDSDGDGVADRAISDTLEVVYDYFPLDASCHKESDGVIDIDLPINRQCYSSWMAEQASVDQVEIAGWDTIEGGSDNFLAYTGEGWGRIVRQILTDTDDANRFVPHVELEGDSVIEVSSTTQQLYYANETGRIRRLLYSENIPSEYAQLPARGTSVVELFSIGTDLLVVSEDNESLSQGYVAFLYDENGVLKGNAIPLPAGIDVRTMILSCKNVDCNDSAELLFITSVDAHNNNEIGLLEIDLSTTDIRRNITSIAFSTSDSSISGPIQLSESGEILYLGSGHQLAYSDLENDVVGETLEKVLGAITFSDFIQIQEVGSHFVALVEDPSPFFEGQEPTSVFVEDLSVSDISIEGHSSVSYLLKQMSADEKIVKILPHRVNNKDDYLILSIYNDLVEVSPIGVTDQDADGMPGIFETLYGLDDSDPTDRFGDLDADGLTNIEEYLMRTKPNNIDSNGNGITDYQEAH